MQFQLRRAPGGGVLLGLTTLVAAQTAPKPAAKVVPWKSYCHPTHEFCFKYPAAWNMLGEVLDGNGVGGGAGGRGGGWWGRRGRKSGQGGGGGGGGGRGQPQRPRVTRNPSLSP